MTEALKLAPREFRSLFEKSKLVSDMGIMLTAIGISGPEVWQIVSAQLRCDREFVEALLTSFPL